MGIESTNDIITALHSCGLTSARAQRAPDSDAIELSEFAAKLLGTPKKVSIAALTDCGPATNDAELPTLGAWLAQRLSTKDPSAQGNRFAIDAVSCSSGERLLCIFSADAVEIFQVDAPTPVGESRELRHRFRNHLNTIVMNIELISMLADQAKNPDIIRAAGRIEAECRACIGNLELL